MDPELKKALDALNMSLGEATEAQNKAIADLREASDADTKKRDAVFDERINKLQAELDKFEPLNEALTKAEAQAKADKAEMQESLDRIEARLQRPEAGDTDAEAKAYAEVFFAFARQGDGMDNERKNLLQVSDDKSAGYLAPPEFVREIIKGISELSPIRDLVTIRRTGARSVQFPKRIGKSTAVWVGETEYRPDTGSPTYGLDDIPVHEMSSFSAVTLQMLEDSAFDLEAELRDDVTEGFGELEAAAIIAGDAHKKPEGILNAKGTIQVNSGAAAEITADSLINLKYSLKTPYARNGNFVLNRATLGKIRLMKDGNGQYLWATGLAAGRANTIDGETYVEMPGMPNVGAGLKPVIFGDLKRGYTLVEHTDVNVQRDPYSLARWGQVQFNWRRRVGGAVRLAEAIAVLNVQA